MDVNIETINSFYSAFSKLDAGGMNARYSNDIVFSDPVFGMLEGEEVRKMWKMLCRNAVGFNLEFGNITDKGDGYYTCDWTASYTFSATGNRVVNKARAYMQLENGLIIGHSDAFRFYKWARQAFGIKGWMFGWTTFFQRRVRARVRKMLANS